jgi:hypothetical protein
VNAVSFRAKPGISSTTGTRSLAALGMTLALTACGLVGESAGGKDAPLSAIADGPVAQAACGPGSRPETGLQGQVPLADRESGRSKEGYQCNLELVGQYQGEGAGWQHAWYEDCSYYGTAYYEETEADRQHLGVVVIDGSDSTSPKPTAYLETAAMIDPWESLKINEKRQFLGAVNGIHGGGGPEIDIYDVAADCAHPSLIVSLPPTNDSGSTGHAGDWAPDGLTYYSANRAIGVDDPTQPVVVGTIRGGLTHDLSISDDGNRAYTATLSAGGYPPNNGLAIFDTSQIQSRQSDPQTPPVGVLFWEDGGLGQNADPIMIGGKPYIMFTDENGPYTLATLATNGTADRTAACGQNLPPFAMARIIDISNENVPTLASRLMLETHDPANCSVTMADLPGTGIFQYDSHYCTVDDPTNATAVACSYFQSGLRVFDIRDPLHPKEVAYFNPPAQTDMKGQLGGSHHDGYGGGSELTADWCSANVRFRKDRGELWATCQDNGFMILKFTNGVWPFKDGT